MVNCGERDPISIAQDVWSPGHLATVGSQRILKRDPPTKRLTSLSELPPPAPQWVETRGTPMTIG